MSPVILSLFTAALTTATVGRLSAGMSAAAETAANFNAELNAEYHLHLCGASEAAEANLTSGADTLGRMFPEESVDWAALADGISGDIHLQDEHPEGICPAGLILHQQSAGETPQNFPNYIYRLPWPTRKD